MVRLPILTISFLLGAQALWASELFEIRHVDLPEEPPTGKFSVFSFCVEADMLPPVYLDESRYIYNRNVSPRAAGPYFLKAGHSALFLTTSDCLQDVLDGAQAFRISRDSLIVEAVATVEAQAEEPVAETSSDAVAAAPAAGAEGGVFELTFPDFSPNGLPQVVFFCISQEELPAKYNDRSQYSQTAEAAPHKASQWAMSLSHRAIFVTNGSCLLETQAVFDNMGMGTTQVTQVQ